MVDGGCERANSGRGEIFVRSNLDRLSTSGPGPSPDRYPRLPQLSSPLGLEIWDIFGPACNTMECQVGPEIQHTRRNPNLVQHLSGSEPS